MPTTSWPRARPGRGCRSRWGSRSCRSTGGTGRPGPCRPSSPPSSRWRSRAARRWPSPTRGSISSATGQRASRRSPPASGRRSPGGCTWPRGSSPSRSASRGLRPVPPDRRSWASGWPCCSAASRSSPGVSGPQARRERAWEVEAVGRWARPRGLDRGRRPGRDLTAGLSPRCRRSVRGRSRSRCGAWRSSGTWRDWIGRRRRSSGPHPESAGHRPGNRGRRRATSSR